MGTLRLRQVAVKVVDRCWSALRSNTLLTGLANLDKLAAGAKCVLQHHKVSLA
jgi:hypothetical protein